MDDRYVYRAKTLDDRWIYGAYLKMLEYTPAPLSSKELTSKDYRNLILAEGFSDWNLPKPINYVEVKEETVGQSTGIKDRNNKLIYEGDIVKFSEHYVGDIIVPEHTEVIEWDNGSFNTELCDTGFHDGPDWCEVIGNRYDNKELLEEVM